MGRNKTVPDDILGPIGDVSLPDLLRTLFCQKHLGRYTQSAVSYEKQKNIKVIRVDFSKLLVLGRTKTVPDNILSPISDVSLPGLLRIFDNKQNLG